MAPLAIDQKFEEILEAAMAGHSAASIAALVFLSSDAKLIDEIKNLMRSTKFNSRLQQGKEDATGTALEALKRTVMRNIEEMKRLATEAEDPRVRFQANKDILDRVGLAPTQKVDNRWTLKDYEKILEGLTQDEPAEAEAESERVVSETKLPAKEGPEGS